MKRILLIASLLLSTAGYASSIQQNCSNATGMISVSLGHFENGVKLTEVSDLGKEKIDLIYKLNDLIIDSKDIKEIRKDVKNTCETNNLDYGTREVKLHYSEFLILIKKDGSLFPEGTIGLSRDGTTISAWMICKREINDSVPCDI